MWVSKIRPTVLLHDRKGLDDDLGGRSDQNLTLSTALGVDDVVLSVSDRCQFAFPTSQRFPPNLPSRDRKATHKSIVEDGDSDHFD